MAKKETLKVRLIGVGYLLIWRLTRMLPESAAVAFWRWSSLRSYRKNERRRAVVRENLRPIVGDGPKLETTVREAFLSYGSYWMEAFRLQDMSDAEVEARIEFVNEDLLDKLHAGGGCVLAVPHVGNWDGAGRYVATRWSLAVVVEVLRPKALFKRFVRYREALGMTIIPLAKGTDPAGRCVEEIRKGKLIALVCDRDLSGTGVEVSMLGRTTKLPAGPAVVALRAGVPLVPAITYQKPGGRWYVRVEEPIATGKEPETREQIEAIMQQLAARFEVFLRECPEQWHAFAPYWTS